MPRAVENDNWSEPTDNSNCIEYRKMLLKRKKDRFKLTPTYKVAFEKKIKAEWDKHLLTFSITNNVDALITYLEMGANPNATDSSERSCLHIAASKGYVEIVRALLKYGADPNKYDSIRNTPLHLAALTHNLPIIRLLIKAGGDVKKTDCYGKSPLHLAKSKLQLLQRSYKNGCVELEQVFSELLMATELLMAASDKELDTVISNIEYIKLCKPEDGSQVLDDQMTKLLQEFDACKI